MQSRMWTAPALQLKSISNFFYFQEDDGENIRDKKHSTSSGVEDWFLCEINSHEIERLSYFDINFIF